MRDELFQYQALAEPLQTGGGGAPETITLDKWNPQHPRPTLRRRRITSHVSATVLDPYPIPNPVAPALDMWEPRGAMPPKAHKPRPTGGTSHIIEPLTITFEAAMGWYRPLSEPRRYPKFITHTFGEPVYSAALAESAVTVDQWAYQQPTRPPATTRQPATLPAVFDPSLFLVPSIAGWFQPLSLPQPKPTRPAGEAVTILDPTLFGVPQIVCWQQPTSVPVRAAPRQTGESVTILDPLLVRTPPLDSWWVQAADLVRVQPRQGGTSLFVPMGVPFVDGWGYSAQMPAFPGWSPPDTGVEVILPLPTPTLDMWQGSTVMPRYPALPRWQGWSNNTGVLLDLRGTGDPGRLDGVVFVGWQLGGTAGLRDSFGGWAGISHHFGDGSMEGIRDNKLYKGEDNPVVWEGLNHKGKFSNTATVAWVLKDSTESTVASGTCTRVAGSNGDYEGNIEEDVALVIGEDYHLEITATSPDDRIGFRRIDYVAQYHGSN
jgi:hypothetical protein